MGWGDEIMAAAEARQVSAELGVPFEIIGEYGKRRWSDLWHGLSYIVAPGDGMAPGFVRNGPGCRPYIDYRRTKPTRWAYTDWRCSPGEIAGVTPDPRAEGYVIVEPNIKGTASKNKQWGWERWTRLVQRMPHIKWLQMGGGPFLPGVQVVKTKDFREACGLLAGCRTAVLPEGGLHHAAAALGKPSVVLFGGMTSPRNTGYDLHTNLAVDCPEALGWRVPHPACQEAWKQITPQLVAEKLEELLDARG